MTEMSGAQWVEMTQMAGQGVPGEASQGCRTTLTKNKDGPLLSHSQDESASRAARAIP